MAFLLLGKSNGYRKFVVNRPNAPLLMPRLLYFLLAFTALLFAACDKDAANNEESTFYGTWVKGPNTGDTLYFYKKNGRSVMRSNQSFNPLMYAPVEYDYKYTDGKLALHSPWSSSFTYDPIESFTWKNAGRQFEINGIELYMFMSSTQTKFTFTKIP